MCFPILQNPPTAKYVLARTDLATPFHNRDKSLEYGDLEQRAMQTQLVGGSCGRTKTTSTLRPECEVTENTSIGLIDGIPQELLGRPAVPAQRDRFTLFDFIDSAIDPRSDKTSVFVQMDGAGPTRMLSAKRLEFSPR